MAMKIVRERQRVTDISYSLDFGFKNDPDGGFSFDCDKDGNLLPFPCQAAQDNYRKCRDNTYNVVFQGLKEHAHTYTEPAVGICVVCGREVELDGFTNTCLCGADYNTFGQRLASRGQWGEETGECLNDILNV